LVLFNAVGTCGQPQTEVVRRALRAAPDESSVRDLLFFEAWAMTAPADIASTLRAAQIRRANPLLTDAIRAELNAARQALGQLAATISRTPATTSASPTISPGPSVSFR